MKPVFSKLIDAANEDTKAKSKEWFREKAQEVDSVDVARVIRQNKESTEASVRAGHLYLYRYNPKTKQTLPYYDRYPIVFPYKKSKDGFIGLNLHYLPIPFRAMLMDGLYEYVIGSRGTTRVNVNYEILSNVFSLRYFKPCIKHYLFDYVETRFLHVDVTEWDVALFLPLQRFLKASEQTIYRDSISIIRKG